MIAPVTNTPFIKNLNFWAPFFLEIKTVHLKKVIIIFGTSPPKTSLLPFSISAEFSPQNPKPETNWGIFFLGTMRRYVFPINVMLVFGSLFTTIFFRLSWPPQSSSSVNTGRHLGATTPGRRSTTPSVCLAHRWIEWIEDLPRKDTCHTPISHTPWQSPVRQLWKESLKMACLVEV